MVSRLTASLYQQGSEAPWSGFRELDRGALLNLAFNSAPNVSSSESLFPMGCLCACDYCTVKSYAKFCNGKNDNALNRLVYMTCSQSFSSKIIK